MTAFSRLSSCNHFLLKLLKSDNYLEVKIIMLLMCMTAEFRLSDINSVFMARLYLYVKH